MKRFLNRLFGFSLGPIFVALLSFIQVPILTHFLPMEEYGKAQLFQSLIIQLPNFLYLGIDQSYTREYNEYRDKTQLIQNGVIIPLAVTFGIGLIGLIFHTQISTYLFSEPQYGLIILYSVIWLLSSILERFFLLSIRMRERAKEYSFYTMLLKIFVFLITIGFVFLGMKNFKAVVYGLIFGQLIGDLTLYLRYRKFFDLSDFHIDKDLQERLLTFGLPLMIAATLTSGLDAVNNMFINHFGMKTDLAIYGSASKISNILGVLKTAFSSFWVPTAYRWYAINKPMKHYKFISDALLFILTGVFFGILLFKGLVVFILGKAYYDVVYIVGLLCFPHIMYTLSETTTLGIVFSRKTAYNVLVSLMTFIPSLLLNYFLTPTLGYRGAAVASSVAYIMFFLSRTYFSSLTGFYFGQRKQILSIILMMIAAVLNMFDLPYILLWTLGLGLSCLVIQFSTILTGIDIYKNRNEWDFN